ncbi:MAG: ABC transporter permease, partial [Bacillota bacterium]
LFPIGGAHTPGLEGLVLVVDVIRHMVLPVITLTTIVLANYVLFVRTSMIDVLREDYITTAHSKGLPNKIVIFKHALKNALLPTITILGLQLGFMVGGAILTETIFAWPGVGRLIFTAVTGHDYPVLQGTFLILAVTVVVASIFTDMAYGYLDPRIKYN